MRSVIFICLMLAALCVNPSKGYSQRPVTDLQVFEQMDREKQGRIDGIAATVESKAKDIRDMERSFPYFSRSEISVAEWRKRSHAIEKVDDRFIKQYRTFLAVNKSAGIFRLKARCFPAAGEALTPECPGPARGFSTYSFEHEEYAGFKFYELAFIGENLSAAAYLTQGVFLSLGDLPIEDVSFTSSGIKVIADLPTVLHRSEAAETAAKLANGVQSGGFEYRGNIKPEVNTTYTLRIIPYEGQVRVPGWMGTKPDPAGLDGGKRFEKIVIFRVLDRDTAGTVTIVWKELTRKDAPKLLID